MIRHLLKQRKLHFFLLVLFLSVAAKAETDHQLFIQGGTYAFSVSTASSSASVSGFGAWTFGYAYAFADKWKAAVTYNYLYSSGTSGDTATGIDVAAYYYPVTFSGYKYVNMGPLETKVTQLFRPYLGFATRQRQFVLVLTTNYIGYGIFGGVEYQLTDKIFLNFEIRADTFYGGDEDAEATQQNVLFGLGYSL